MPGTRIIPWVVAALVALALPAPPIDDGGGEAWADTADHRPAQIRTSERKRKRVRKRKRKRSAGSCLRELKRHKVRYTRAKRRGIAIAVRVRGPIAGVEYRGYKRKALILDCSLVVSLARMGPHLTAQGITRATYSSAYQRRRVRGSKRWSKHSFGLAIDVHAFMGDELGKLTVRDDYEQGLGDDDDCIGKPLTRGGAILRTLHCQFEQSGAFHYILTPDYDAGHYNHFHIEADPWAERSD
jgi:hypothetical protein